MLGSFFLSFAFWDWENILLSLILNAKQVYNTRFANIL